MKKVTLAQINPTVGDIAGNISRMQKAVATAQQADSRLVVFPEMCVLGYPARDLLLREGIVEQCEAAVAEFAEQIPDGMTAVVGHPRRGTSNSGMREVRNSISICTNQSVVQIYDKQLLPGYDVFDEDRYFDPGSQHCTLKIDKTQVGILICEDFWQARDAAGGSRVIPEMSVDFVQQLRDNDCEWLIIPSASPFVVGKDERHIAQLAETAKQYNIGIVMVNQVGANDDLIFNGGSIVIDNHGNVIGRCDEFNECVQTIDLAASTNIKIGEADPVKSVFDALVLGVRDYCRKTGHSRVTIGLSGGIDSALTATIATVALGAEHVTGVMMPSRYSSEGSIDDAKLLARNLGINSLLSVPIEPAHQSFQQLILDGTVHGETGVALIKESLNKTMTGVADENIQARIRGMILMAISNADSSLVLATGNKSELAVGYCTLYGDMIGALAVIGDVLKTDVYALSRWINKSYKKYHFSQPPIPDNSIEKPPSAELRPDQTDQDSLPPYEMLDEIVRRYIECEQSTERIVVETDFDQQMVRRFCRVIDINEYKRRQAAIVLKVSPRAFGPGRPMPVAAQHG